MSKQILSGICCHKKAQTLAGARHSKVEKEYQKGPQQFWIFLLLLMLKIYSIGTSSGLFSNVGQEETH